MTRVLITGASGFVGQYLSRLLQSPTREVFGTFIREHVSGFPPGVKMLACDLRRESQVRDVVRDVRPRQVYHLAALSSVRESFENSRLVYESNFWGTLNLLSAVRDTQPSARVLLVSSGHTYGPVRRSHLPIKETEPLNPDSPYGVSKAAADMLGSQFFQNHGLQVVRARPFNHTGPGQSPHFVCSNFTQQFAAIELGINEPVIRVGNIGVRRDFSDVRDVVRAYVMLMAKGSAGEAYNVGSGRAISLRDVLGILRSLCSRKVRIAIEPDRLRRREATWIIASNQKLRHATGWRVKLDFRTTLSDLYGYWMKQLQSGSARVQSGTPPQSQISRAEQLRARSSKLGYKND